jgi:hypothetical protein
MRFEELIRLLAAAGADLIVIGGLALIFHGGDYATQDVGFSLVRKRDNARIIASVLAPYHALPVGWPDGVPFVWDEAVLMNSTTLTLTTDLCRVDFMAEPDGAPPYPELKARADKFDLDGATVYVACIEDLISMKRAGRPKDLAHAAELETIQKLLDDRTSG